MARESKGLLERISKLRKGFEEARAHGRALIPTLDAAVEAVGNRRPVILALGEILQSVSGSEVDALPSPTYLTQGMQQLLKRGAAVAERLQCLPSHLTTTRGVDKKSATAALGAFVRSVATLPDSVVVQDLRLEGLEAQMLLLEHVTADLETSQVSAVSRKRCILALMRLMADLHAGGGLEGNRLPDTACLEPIVSKILELARRTNWREEALWVPTGALQDRAMLIAVDGWNVAVVMARVCLTHACPIGVELEEVVLAGLLHDLGMLDVPEALMQQVEPWNAMDRGAMEGHTRRGARILERWLPGAVAARAMALWHHERPDGTGYPDALLESEIPELARLGAVADMVCGLLLPRGNRPAAPWDEAVRVAIRSAEVGLLDLSWVKIVAGLAGPAPVGLAS